MVFLGPQDPRPRLVSDATVSGEYPSRYSERPEYKQVVNVDEEDMVDDEGVEEEREIWEVTHVSEKDLETTEGKGVDFLAELLELEGWSQVNDKETEKTCLHYCLDDGLIHCFQHGLCFLTNIVETNRYIIRTFISRIGQK